jgi:hypothetical protein
MTMASISQAANDPQLQARVLAAAQREIIFNEELANTDYGKRLAMGGADVMPLMYRVAVDTEDAYATALAAGRGAPGHDADIVTDAQITAAIVAGWPPEQPLTPGTLPAGLVAQPSVQPAGAPPPVQPSEPPAN